MFSRGTKPQKRLSAECVRLSPMAKTLPAGTTRSPLTTCEGRSWVQLSVVSEPGSVPYLGNSSRCLLVVVLAESASMTGWPGLAA